MHVEIPVEESPKPDGSSPPGAGKGENPRSATEDKWYDSMAGVMVTALGLLVLLGIMILAILEMPNNTSKDTNIVALATAGFGVIGAITGAYFGVRSANKAVKRMSEKE